MLDDVPDVLMDATSVITLFSRKVPGRKMNDLGNAGKVRLPGAVQRELERGTDKAASWIRAHPEFVIKERDEHLREIARVARVHGSILTTSRQSADVVLVSMAIFYRDSKMVVTDDAGVQAACARERLISLPVGAFQLMARLFKGK